VVIEKKIGLFQGCKPEDRRYTIRFLRAPSDGWADGDAPADDNTERVRWCEDNKYLAMDITADGEYILERGSCGLKLANLKTS
jgi:hypothetical protein